MDKTGIPEIDEFVELISSIDTRELPIEDQIKIAAAYVGMINKVKPILLKHLGTVNGPQSFLFKL